MLSGFSEAGFFVISSSVVFQSFRAAIIDDEGVYRILLGPDFSIEIAEVEKFVENFVFSRFERPIEELSRSSSILWIAIGADPNVSQSNLFCGESTDSNRSASTEADKSKPSPNEHFSSTSSSFPSSSSSSKHTARILMAKPVKLNLVVDKSKQSIGSMNNLLESVPSLNSDCFSSEACRSMLLRPSNSAPNLYILVSHSSVEFSIEQLSKLNIKQRSSLESVSVEVTAAKIVELLKRLLVSDTPLTDVFLGVHKENDNLQVIQQPLRPKCDETIAPTTFT